MSIIDVIFKRRSIRKYQDKPVAKESIITLLEAAMAAPTAINSQPWEFIVSDDEEKLSQIKQTYAFARYNAPTAILVCGNMEHALEGQNREYWIQDCSAATQNILLTATDLGLGSVWIGIYPYDNRIQFLRELFNLPKHITPLNIIYVGYPAEQKEPRTQYNESKVHWHHYDGLEMQLQK